MSAYSEKSETIIRVLSRIMEIPTTVLAVVGSLWIFAMMVLINLDVFGRALFSRPVDGVPEIVSMSIVGIVFLQVANTLRKGRFISSDMFLARVHVKWPRVGQAAEAVFHLLGALTFATVTWYVAPKFADAWIEGTYVGSLGRFMAPIWPILLIILIGSALTALQYLVTALHHLLAALGHVAKPQHHHDASADFD